MEMSISQVDVIYIHVVNTTIGCEHLYMSIIHEFDEIYMDMYISSFGVIYAIYCINNTCHDVHTYQL